jgi:hypothetical protein
MELMNGKSLSCSRFFLIFGKKLKEKGFKQSKERMCRYWKGTGVYTLR